MNTRTAPRAAPAQTLPAAVRLLGSLLLMVLLLVAWARWQGVSTRQPDAPTLWQRELNFRDGPAGEVLVLDAHTGATVAHFQGEQGFLRSTLRALVRERKREGIGAQAPVQLIGRSDGRLTLLDPATGQRIDLEAFGPSNAAVFAGLRQAGTHLYPLMPRSTP